MADKECGCADDERCFDCATDSELAAAVPPYVVNPEAIGDPDQTPIVQLPPVSDPREELRSLIENAVMGEEQVMRWEDAAADAVLAAGYVKLSDLASDPDVIEKVARYEVAANRVVWDNHPDLHDGFRAHARRFLSTVAAALAATPGDSNE